MTSQIQVGRNNEDKVVILKLLTIIRLLHTQENLKTKGLLFQIPIST